MADFVAIFDEDVQVRQGRKKGGYLSPLTEFQALAAPERDRKLRQLFRFHEEGIRFICSIIEEDLKPKHGQKGHPIPLDIQVLTTLHYLASNEFQIHLGGTVKMSQPTASNCIARVTKALSMHSAEFIHLPNRNSIEETRIKREFYEYCHIPFILGAIDCTHCRIQWPPGEDQYAYLNRKRFYSINVQAIVSLDCKFLNVVARWPGGCHDSHILRQSQIWDYFESGIENTILLGDSGYPLKPWLMVPYPRPNTRAEKRFNNALSRARCVVERAFGQMKKRFTICHTGFRIGIDRICDAIVACFMLHNIATQYRLPEIDDDLDPEIEGGPDAEDFHAEWANVNENRSRMIGMRKRNELAQRFE